MKKEMLEKIEAAFEAVRNNDVGRLHSLITREGVSIEICCSDPAQALKQVGGLTVWHGKNAVSVGLILKGIFSPSFLGILAGALLWFAWDKEIAPFTYDKTGWTLLHYAAVHNSINVANYLIGLQMEYNLPEGRKEPYVIDTAAIDPLERTYKDIADALGYTDFTNACRVRMAEVTAYKAERKGLLDQYEADTQKCNDLASQVKSSGLRYEALLAKITRLTEDKTALTLSNADLRISIKRREERIAELEEEVHTVLRGGYGGWFGRWCCCFRQRGAAIPVAVPVAAPAPGMRRH